MRRKKMASKKSKSLFRSGAKGTHKKNVAPAPMRGGWRL